MVTRLEALSEQLREHGEVTGIGGGAQQLGGRGGNLLRPGPADKVPGHGAVLPIGIAERITKQRGMRARCLRPVR